MTILKLKLIYMYVFQEGEKPFGDLSNENIWQWSATIPNNFKSCLNESQHSFKLQDVYFYLNHKWFEAT